jgi:hypothetical protein
MGVEVDQSTSRIHGRVPAKDLLAKVRGNKSTLRYFRQSDISLLTRIILSLSSDRDQCSFEIQRLDDVAATGFGAAEGFEIVRT